MDHLVVIEYRRGDSRHPAVALDKSAGNISAFSMQHECRGGAYLPECNSLDVPEASLAEKLRQRRGGTGADDIVVICAFERAQRTRAGASLACSRDELSGPRLKPYC